MMRAVACLAAAWIASASASASDGGLRDDPTRHGTKLVRVNRTIHEFAGATGGFLAGHFDRDDFESIALDHVVLWASEPQLRVMDAAGLRSLPHPDVGALSFAAEKARGYMDKAGEEPEWDEYCGYDCMTERLTLLADECRFPFELFSIGESVQGRTLWGVKLGDTGPEVLLGGNIHGDEPVGNMAIQRWIYESCIDPSDEQVEAALGAQAFFVPNLNPDGKQSTTDSRYSGLNPTQSGRAECLCCCSFAAARDQVTRPTAAATPTTSILTATSRSRRGNLGTPPHQLPRQLRGWISSCSTTLASRRISTAELSCATPPTTTAIPRRLCRGRALPPLQTSTRVRTTCCPHPAPTAMR
jgi:hypothetical protein